ncbi:MAG: hypothetical protein KJ622_05940 [Alphaproteobacteria bacterium]|nr:hypothetical protein [Alphaproteobacteria bacterium]
MQNRYLKSLNRRQEPTLFAAAFIFLAGLASVHAEDFQQRKYWWGFTSVEGWPQSVSLWQDFDEITIIYTGNRWCTARAKLTTKNIFEQIASSCDHMKQNITTIRLSDEGSRLKYQIMDGGNHATSETGYLVPIK